MGVGVAGVGVASSLVGTEICAPLLLLCWLCCWPDDSQSESSSTGKHPKEPVVSHGGRRRRSSELFGRRLASSALSLHLPSTSGHAKPPSAHRSHEEIPRRRGSQPEGSDARYHSAPSVIHEVLHRRDWERSARDLAPPPRGDTIPLAEPETSSLEDDSYSPESGGRTCKKHHTNIKSSKKGKFSKEATSHDVKDRDLSEGARGFYIGEVSDPSTALSTGSAEVSIGTAEVSTGTAEVSTGTAEVSTGTAEVSVEVNGRQRADRDLRTKLDKQCFNESIRNKEGARPKALLPVAEHAVSGGFVVAVVDELDGLETPGADRSGAVHHSLEARAGLRPCVFRLAQYPPPSVEPVSYEGGACYLAEAGSLASLRRPRPSCPSPPLAGAGAVGAVGAGMRSRHASDGDILAPPLRPESGAFSESDLDLELEGCEELPPAYSELQHYRGADVKETAI